jgi:hypothetical protein
MGGRMARRDREGTNNDLVGESAENSRFVNRVEGEKAKMRQESSDVGHQGSHAASRRPEEERIERRSVAKELELLEKKVSAEVGKTGPDAPTQDRCASLVAS